MLELICDRPALCHDSETTLDLLVRITPPAPPRGQERPDINLSLVLDRSGSMAGKKLEMTCAAASLAVARLRAQDRVSVVVFDNAVETLVPCTAPTDKRRIEKLLATVRPGGSTALCDGWRQGVSQASLARDSRRLNRVVLLTDGEANAGETNTDVICSEVRQFAMQGVQTTTLGFGASYNETLLRSMAASGEGNHVFVEHPEELAAFFDLELEGLATTRGTQVRLTVEPLAEGVVAAPIARMQRAQDGSLMLGDLVAGRSLEVLVRVRVPAQSKEQPVLAVRLSYHCLESARTESLEAGVVLPVVGAAERAAMPVHPSVAVQVAVATAASLRDEAMNRLTDGQEGLAMRLLRQALKLPHLPAQERELLRDLIETLERQDYSSGHKKAAMHGHGHSKGHGSHGMLRPRNSGDALRALLADGEIALGEGPLLATVPPSRAGAWKRFEGMLRGLAHGEARGHAAAWADVGGTARPRRGEATDLSLATLRQLSDWGAFNGMRLANEFARAPVARISPSLEAFRQQIKRGFPWHDAGAASAGCGALRRIAPVLAAHLNETAGLWSDVALAGMLTHNDNASLTGCLGFASLFWELAGKDAPPASGWYAEHFLQAIEGLEKQSYTATAPRYDGWNGTLSAYVRMVMGEARCRALSVEQALREWGSGPFVLEMVPSLLYVLELHGADPERALREATRTSLEAGSLGALVGAALGALHGTIPGWELDPEMESALQDLATTFDMR